MFKIYKAFEKENFYEEIKENEGYDVLIWKERVNVSELKWISQINNGKYSIFVGNNYVLMQPTNFVDGNEITFLDKDLALIIEEI